jgi:septal ring factor EnvC (AmiA/AmiB activator)
MVEALDSSEEAKKNLLQEIAALRKQSVIALVLAVLFILITIYLYFQLQQSKEDLRESYARLEDSNKKLIASEKQLESMNKELDNFRQTIIAAERSSETAASEEVAMAPPPTRYAQVYKSKQKGKAGADQSCLGYVIYIQDREGSGVSAALRQTLKDKGGIVPAIEHIAPSRAFSSSVRYFHEEDKDIATYLQQTALATFRGQKGASSAQPLPIQFIPNKKVPLGQLEIWIDQ